MPARSARPLVLIALVADVLVVALAIGSRTSSPIPSLPMRVLGEARTEAAALVPPTPAPQPAVAAPAVPVPPVDPFAALLAARPSSCLYATSGESDLVSLNAGGAVAPASAQKVLVATAALDRLGPAHRFETSVVSSSAPVDGVVDALWLVGGGDPGLSTPEYAAFLASRSRWRDVVPTRLDHLADRVVAAGVRKVAGGVLGDASRYEHLDYLPTWKPGYAEEGSISPVRALTVNGGWWRWTPAKDPVSDAPVHAAAELTRLLRDRGVEVAGPPATAPAPSSATRIAAMSSAPLKDVLTSTLRASDNLAAELVTRELGLAEYHEGTTAAGTRAIVASLRDQDVDVRGVALVDGSGLDTGNRATCKALVQALRAEPGGVSMADLLAVAGRSGTLTTRLKGTPLEGRLQAKTGWIGGVVSMTGRIGGVTFAVVQNGVPNLQDGRALETQVLSLLSGLPAAAA